MSRSLNRIEIIGHVGSEPESRSSASGVQVVKFSVATSEKFKDREEKTQWHRVTAFSGLASICEQYLRKGQQVYVAGRMEYNRHTGDDGVEKFFADIIASEVIMLGGKSAGSRDEDDDEGAQYLANQRRQQEKARSTPLSEPDDLGDLPF